MSNKDRKLRTSRYFVGVEEGVYRFRRRWAAERALAMVPLDPGESAVLGRKSGDGGIEILQERQATS